MILESLKVIFIVALFFKQEIK